MRCIPIRSDLDIVAARVEGRNLAKEIGFDIIDQARIATAITELARNVVLYAGVGTVKLRRISPADVDDEQGHEARLSGEQQAGIEVVCEDEGPGIRDLEGILCDGYAVGRGLGTGLSGTRRLMDEFDIRSEVGVGTSVRVCKWLR